MLLSLEDDYEKLVAFLVACLMAVLPFYSAMAYPTVGTSPQYTLPVTRDSGTFTNYHFPTKYFRGNNTGFEVELNSATVGGTEITVVTYKHSINSGADGTWYKHGTGTTNTDELGICSFKSSSSYYYCYKLTKTTSGKININYTVRNTP